MIIKSNKSYIVIEKIPHKLSIYNHPNRKKYTEIWTQYTGIEMASTKFKTFFQPINEH